MYSWRVVFQDPPYVLFSGLIWVTDNALHEVFFFQCETSENIKKSKAAQTMYLRKKKIVNNNNNSS